jgi:hypothetical protein
MIDGPSPFWPILTLTVGTIAWAAAVRGRRGDVAAPFGMLMLLLMAIFAVRPLFMIGDNAFILYGANVSEGFNDAAIAGFLGTAAAALGYLIASRRRAPAIYPDEVHDNDRAVRYSMYRAFFTATVLILGWFLIMASRGGAGFITQLFGGRNDETNAVLKGLPAFVGAMPTAAAILVAVIRISTERERRLYFGEWCAFYLTIGLSIVPPMALGTRRYLLPCLLAAIIAATAPHYRRIVRLRYLALGVFAFLFLAIVPFVRSTGSRQGHGDVLAAMSNYFQTQGLVGSLRPFFTSYDTEMFSYVAYLAPKLGGGIPYGLGRGTLGDTLLNPLPASLMPFPRWSDHLLQLTFGGTCAQGICPVPSVVGVLMYDLAIPGVVIGCFLIGMACCRYPEWLARASNARLVFVLGVAAFSPVLIRGNTVNIGYITAMTCVLAAGGLWMCRGRMRSPVGRVRRPLVALGRARKFRQGVN